MKDLVTVRIESPGFDADAVRIAEITGTETISRLFELTLRLVALDPANLDEEKLLTNAVELVFERTDDTTHVVTEERRIGGMFSVLRDRYLTESEHREVIATFVPRAWQTTLTKTTDIFMDMSIPDIVKKKLETGAGLVGADVELRLKNTYPKREFVVQYKESDYAFIARLTEDLGIHFFFEKKGDKDVMVFADENAAFKPSLPESAPFMKRGEGIGVYELAATRTRIPKMFKARDYNYRNPSMDLAGEAESKSLGAAGTVDEFGPHAKTADEAKFYAEVRAQEAAAGARVYEGESDLPGLRAGSHLKIEGHPNGELALVVVEVVHQGRQAVYGSAAGDVGYHNRFKAIPEAIAFRPARITPKPVVHGVVTGIVQSSASTNFGAIDEEGRYRVSFMYDTVTGRDEGKASRPLRMAQPSAGADRGFHQPLKVGTEVIITCLNGDPDRPIISGAVPNPQTPSPVTSANAEKSMWKTNVSQMAFDDDQPRMKMTVSGEDHLFQIGEPNGPEFGFMTGTVGNATSMVEGVNTTHSSIKSAWDGWKNDFASDDIVAAAGVPNPWAKWKKWEAMASAAVDTLKAASSILDNAAQMADGDLKKAKEEKEEADEAKTEADKTKADADKALAAALKKAEIKDEDLKPQMTVETVKDPKDPTKEKQVVKTETRAQALDRAAGEKAKTDADLGKAIKDANDADKAAKEAADKVETETTELAAAEETKDERVLPEPLVDVAGVAMLGASPVAGAVILAKGKDVTVGDVKALTKFVDETQQKLKSLKEKAESLVKLASLVPGGKKLISFLSGKLGKIAAKAIDKSTGAFQIGAQVNARRSGERKAAVLGRFGDPHNIQYGRDSAAIHGMKNAFVFGGATASLHSRGHASVVGNTCVHIKSSTECEIAAPEVKITGKKQIDAFARETMLLVAASKGVKMEAGSSIVMNGQKDVHLISDDKSLHIKANENVSVLAKTKNLVMTAEQDILVLSNKGNLDVDVKTGKAKIAVKSEIDISTKTKMTVKATNDLTLDSDNAIWKAANDMTFDVKGGMTFSSKKDIDVKGKNLNLKGTKINLK